MNKTELNNYLLKQGVIPLDMSKISSNELHRYNHFITLCENHVAAANTPSILTQPNTRKFQFMYIEDDELNAFAVPYKDIDVIGLNTGTIRIINSYLTKAVNCGIFPWVNTMQGRNILAELLLNMAIEFIILHELGHHFNGHLLAEDLLSFRYMKVSYEVELESRAIEMDADAYATTRSFSKYLEQDIEKKMPTIARNKLDMLRYWVFATHSFFFLFESMILDYNTMKLDPYYPRIIRQALNIDISTRIVKMKATHFLSEYEEVLNESFVLAESIFKMIYKDGTSIRMEEIKSITDYRVVKYMEEVDSYYQNTLLPKLKPYARHKLYDKTEFI